VTEKTLTSSNQVAAPFNSSNFKPNNS
jgi:hypothetical protein